MLNWFFYCFLKYQFTADGLSFLTAVMLKCEEFCRTRICLVHEEELREEVPVRETDGNRGTETRMTLVK